MAISISIAGPTMWDGTPGQIMVRASGDYSPDVFNDLSNQVVGLWQDLFEIDGSGDPAVVTDDDLPPDPDGDTAVE